MAPAPHPLTHHEILDLVEPFTRRGRRVDLAASDRIARRLVFAPVAHGADAATPALRETLELTNAADDADAGTGGFRLTRVLDVADGFAARLQVDGPDVAALLAAIDAVAPQRQVRAGPGHVVAESHRIDGGQLVLTRGVVRLDGLTLTLEPPTVRGMRADIAVVAPGLEPGRVPEDLLAVLGRDWARLTEAAVGWRSSLRLRGAGAARSRDAERRLAQAATHLARTLAEPPGRFHDRLRAARWRVYARRSVPLLVSIGLIVAAASAPKLGLGAESPWRMLIFNAPPLLLLLAFSLRELPRIEIPPWPRRSQAASWWRTPAAPASAEDAEDTGDASCSATR